MIIIQLFMVTLLNFISCNDITIDVNTTSGLVRGQSFTSWLDTPLNITLHVFLGIPYAKPPLGELRFAKPEPITTPLPVSKLQLQ